MLTFKEDIKDTQIYLGLRKKVGWIELNPVPEQRNKKILDEVRKVAFKDSLIDILKNLDQDLVKGAVAGEKFQELFFANCKCDKLAEYVKTLLA